MPKLDRIIEIKSALKSEVKMENRITDLYKNVFMGHPWHEDKICKNSLVKGGPCLQQYTEKNCQKYDGGGINNCRDEYASRENITLLDGTINTCVSCGEELELIDFYQDFVNHVDLFREAVSMQGFIGFVGEIEGELAGFSWGYKVPKEDTKSVLFEKINQMLIDFGMNPEETYYAAETGVVDVFQSGGRGSALSLSRIMKAKDAGYRYMITRTISDFVVSIFRKGFGGTEARFLFKDPERSSKWYAWKFEDFDSKYAQTKISAVTEKSSEQ